MKCITVYFFSCFSIATQKLGYDTSTALASQQFISPAFESVYLLLYICEEPQHFYVEPLEVPQTAQAQPSPTR